MYILTPSDSTAEINHFQITMALIAIIATSIAALVYTIRTNSVSKNIEREATLANKNATEANKAVNNVGPGEHRLYDVIARIESKQDDFDKRWGNLPDNLNNAVSLSQTIHDIKLLVDSLDKKITSHLNREEEHLDLLKELEVKKKEA